MPYRVVGRNRERLASTFGSDPLAEMAVWDPNDPASVRAAAEGIGTLIYLVGIPYHKAGQHPIVMQQTLDDAVAAGVKRIVLLGTVYSYGPPETPTVADTHSRNPPTFKGRMRKEQEEILFRAHAEGKIEAAVLRLPDFYGPEVGLASFLHLAFKAATEGGTAYMIGPSTPRTSLSLFPTWGL